MTGETNYIVKAKHTQESATLLSLWESRYVISHESNCFSCFGRTVYDAIAQVIKVTNQMEQSKATIPFVIVGKHETDYDCSIFEIIYDGSEPCIKAMYGNLDFEEEAEDYADCMAATDDEISDLLAGKKAWTFRDAIDGIEDTLSDAELEAYYAEDSDEDFEEDLDLQGCFGGFMEMSYEEWVEKILADTNEYSNEEDEDCDDEEDWDDEN